MGTVAGTLRAVPPGGPVNSNDTIQFRNRSTFAVTNAAVSDSGQYAISLPVGTYDVGVNGVYRGNTPSSIVVTTLPKYQDITSPNTKEISSNSGGAVLSSAAPQARSYRLWIVDPIDLAQFSSWGALKQFVVDIERQGYLVHAERAHFKVTTHNLERSPTCPLAEPRAPIDDQVDALIVWHPDPNVTSPPQTTHPANFVGGGIVRL